MRGGGRTPGREAGCSWLPLQDLRREAGAESASAKVDGFSSEFCSSEPSKPAEGGERVYAAHVDGVIGPAFYSFSIFLALLLDYFAFKRSRAASCCPFT